MSSMKKVLVRKPEVPLRKHTISSLLADTLQSTLAKQAHLKDSGSAKRPKKQVPEKTQSPGLQEQQLHLKSASSARKQNPLLSFVELLQPSTEDLDLDGLATLMHYIEHPDIDLEDKRKSLQGLKTQLKTQNTNEEVTMLELNIKGMENKGYLTLYESLRAYYGVGRLLTLLANAVFKEKKTCGNVAVQMVSQAFMKQDIDWATYQKMLKPVLP
uniref:Uncharacterized protein n=1 Tax=Peronospora matthiolae TaxID=2874970 RepID=A0AAV1TX08_9STRA